MTVKLGKLFSSNSSTNSTTHNKMSSPPPLPPPNPSLSCNYYNANTNQHHHQLQQKSQRAFNPYVDEMEDDDISLYSTTASIITARDHPYNNSQRPLLADRKPQLLLGSNANNNKKKTKNQTAANQQSSPKLSQNHHQQQQQQQPQQQQLQQQQQQQEQKQKPEQKSYISPYVQQQKRDSVKGLHGFNDFDILSQQYNKHLQSPHIGYPYGSPPSPNSNSTAVDFVFDSADSTTTPIYRNNYASISTPLTVTTCYGNAVCDYGSTLATSAMTEVNAIDYYRSNTNVDAINKLSRFEDDFCNRRNINFAKIDQKLTTSDDTNLYEGPFIFGIPPEQQTDFTRLGINGRSFDDITSCKAVITNNGKQKLDKSMKQTVTYQYPHQGTSGSFGDILYPLVSSLKPSEAGNGDL
uniref:Uncharacterized protein n=1 Tax=Glossina pallidipes TaxID=7398 RepID=A0A1B0A108_GLOPL